MSVPPPPPPSSAESRTYAIALEPGRGWARKRTGEHLLRLTPAGAVVEHTGLVAPLHLPLGQLQLGLVDPGPARAGSMTGRFAVLKRIGANAVVPREHGIEGWLWTSESGSGLTFLGDAGEAPNAVLLLTAPLGEEVIAASFGPAVAAEIAARSPLGAPALHGLLLRVCDTVLAERAFGQYGLVRPLTDREVPPTLRRSLPTDRAADPLLVAGEGTRALTSVAPPGMG
jgi:hypothetical protein